MNRKLGHPGHQSGAIMLEALIAILVFSIGVLALIGLQAVMISNASDANYRSQASFLAQRRIAELWADPANAANLSETDTDISNFLPQGKRTTEQITIGEFRVLVTWQPPGDPSDLVVHQHVTIARIVGGV